MQGLYALLDPILNLDILSRYGWKMVQGLGLTLELVAISVTLGFLAAYPIARARIAGPWFLAWPAAGFEGKPELPPFVTAMIALGLVMGAFSSEVWAGALSSVAKGQREAARAMALSKRHAFWLVEFPQALRVALPGLGNNWMVLLKETSLASVITMPEFMYVTARANTVTKEPFLFFGFACLVYLALSLVSMAGIGRLEAFAARGHGAR